MHISADNNRVIFIKGMNIMRILNRIALIGLIIGGLNWGLVGIFDFNLVSYITGGSEIFSDIIYAIVALCAVWCVSLLFRSDNEIVGNE